MIKQLMRVILVLMLFGVTAVASRADSTSDFRVILNDPSCTPAGTTCVAIGYDGTSEADGVLFLAPSPIQIPAGQTAACSTDIGSCYVFFPGDGDGNSDDYFYGVLFIGDITPGEDFDIGVNGLSSFSLLLPANFQCETASQCANGVINLTATPEPPTILLLVLGLTFVAILRRRKSMLAVPLCA
jgi:hypothetical protein